MFLRARKIIKFISTNKLKSDGKCIFPIMQKSIKGRLFQNILSLKILGDYTNELLHRLLLKQLLLQGIHGLK